MKIIVCCEGSTDASPLTVLIKKCSHIDIEIDCRTREDLRKIKVLNTGFLRNITKKNDQITRVLSIRKLNYLVITSECRHVAFHQDSDNQEFRKIYNDIHNDFNKVLPPETKCLAIVPKKMTESWLLADVKAINSLGNKGKLVDQSPNPEDLSDAKTYLRRNLEEIGAESNSATYTKIAENINITVLKTRCPESFGQFYTDMQTFITQEPSP